MHAENKDDGGPAFPQRLEFVGPTNDPIKGTRVPTGTTEVHIFPGMSLLDHFACNAPSELFDEARYSVTFGRSDLHMRRFGALPPDVQAEVLKEAARMQYEYAQAMLEARK